EEDHLRIQAVLRGFQLNEAFVRASQLDDSIAARIKYSFDPELGYLTSCPTNLGTGMRASVMLFLPALAIMSKGNIAGNLGTPNITVRGIYGEGSDADGHMYQVSNSRTLGVSEREIIDTVTKTVQHLINTEGRARELLLNNDPIGVRDQIMRALGVLTHAYTLTAKEFMQLIALVKLGVHYKFINIGDPERLEKLIIETQPSSISYASGRELSPEERDICRADYVGKVLRAMT
ncbi:MAG: ATP--guanido phosphotransferase, partial [Firmicutes bacterium]|nr:ATP--guanido phosphotransferase [Bacillota bacterium]